MEWAFLILLLMIAFNVMFIGADVGRQTSAITLAIAELESTVAVLPFASRLARLMRPKMDA